MAGRKLAATPLIQSELPDWQLARRQQIVAAARALLDRQPYEQIQIREVAARAGVALGTLYRYFRSKEHLYAEVLLDWAAPIGREPRHRDRSTEERLRSKVHMVVAAMEQKPQFFRLLITLRSSTEPVVVELMARQVELSERWFTSELADLGSDGAADSALMLWSIINTMLIAAVFHGRPMSEVRRIADRFIDLIAPQLAGGAATGPRSSGSSTG